MERDTNSMTSNQLQELGWLVCPECQVQGKLCDICAAVGGHTLIATDGIACFGPGSAVYEDMKA